MTKGAVNPPSPVSQSPAHSGDPDPSELRTAEQVIALYAARHDARRADADRFAGQEHGIGNQRLAVFVAALLLAYGIWGRGWLSPWTLLLPLIAFVGLLFQHERVSLRKRDALRAVKFYEQGLRRLENRWQGSGNGGASYVNPQHPYTPDLDVFGRGSLFELLCTCRTLAGEACLARWLQAPADPAIVRARQMAVQELTLRLGLREALALLGQDVRDRLQPDALTAWAALPFQSPSPVLTWTPRLLVVVNLVSLLAWQRGAPGWVFWLCFALSQLWAQTQRTRIKSLLLTSEAGGRSLALLAAILARLEAEPTANPLLTGLTARLQTGGLPPSAQIARLQKRFEWLDARRSPLFAPIDALLLWTPQMVALIENWRGQNGPQIPVWLDTIGEWEALCALAGYASEHPDDAFPTVQTPADASDFALDARAFAHPLLPADAIRNDLRFAPEHRLFILSGSNMSGKSTLLRALGTNLVLALAGAPVRAENFTLTPFAVGASLRTQDSLEGGISRFYAEILRLRQIVEQSRQSPRLLFLLDEILSGTNSHDRRVGASAVIRTLVENGAVGLVTTHDLALAQIADDSILAATNIHLQDQIRDGKIEFDYRLRPGVVAHSNALELMRAVGLDV